MTEALQRVGNQMTDKHAHSTSSTVVPVQGLLVLSWAAAVYWLGSSIGSLSPIAVYVATLALGLPVLWSSLYLLTVRKIHGLARFESAGWFHRLMSGRVLGTIFWSVFALVSTFALLIQFHAYTTLEWVVFFAVVPLFIVVFSLLQRISRNEFKPYQCTASSLIAASWITPFVAVLGYMGVLWVVGGVQHVDSLHQAIDIRRGALVEPAGSALVQNALELMAYFDGARVFVASRLSDQASWLALVILAVGSWFVFFIACLALSAFMISRVEYRRVFSGLSDAAEPAAPEFGRVLVASAVFTLIVVFVALPSFITLEAGARQAHPAIQQTRYVLETAVVMVDGIAYRAELLEEHKKLRLALVSELDAIQPRLLASLDAGFERIEANVEPFLDWYYGLTAEYLRMLKLLSGDLEDFIASEMRQHLERGEPFGEYEAVLDQAISTHQALDARFQAATKEMLARNVIDTPLGEHVRVLSELSLQDLVQLPTLDESIPLSVRMGGGGATGAVTTLVVSKVSAKIFAKGVIKLAAQPLLKAVVARGAATLLGAGSGAVAGSVVPGVGTAIGGVLGAAVGLMAGASVDYGLLKLEEHLQRDVFRAQLLEAIHETRMEIFDLAKGVEPAV